MNGSSDETLLMVERCCRRQGEQVNYEAMLVDGGELPHPKHPVTANGDGPNLVLWTGFAHRLVLTLKYDDE